MATNKYEAVTKIELPGRKKISSGKVREMFEEDDAHLLMVATDRISAFDVIMAEGIPEKGKILTALSLFWFDKTKSIIKNHFVSSHIQGLPEDAKLRTLKILRAKPLPIECIVRGYLAGSGWKEYQLTGEVSGHKLPAGLMECSELPHPIFTPSTKAVAGHDESISIAKAEELLGKNIFEVVQKKSLEIYHFARSYALSKGIIIADTKFEFGLFENEVILIDEVLTPDSSRFWPQESYSPGKSQLSYDKQYLRDYLESCEWDKCPPPPVLPDDVIKNTQKKYIEAFEKLTSSVWT